LVQIHDLGIQDEIIYMHNVSPAARNRFIYYPDHLVKMPGGDETFSEWMASFWTESIYKGVLKAATHDIFGDRRDESLRDESVSSFFNRRFHSPDLTNNIISAVIHGIYAGDIDRLSVKSIFRPLWDIEQNEGSLLLGTIKRQLRKKQDLNDSTVSSSMSANIVPPSLVPLTRNARAFSFRQGICTLSEALERFLKAKPHPTVEFKMNKRVSRVEYDTESDGIQASSPISHTHSR
jgi:oxygen-dependent protoporphyrinogen oxidase